MVDGQGAWPLASFGTIGTENQGTSNAFPVHYYGQKISFGDHTLGEQIKPLFD